MGHLCCRYPLDPRKKDDGRHLQLLLQQDLAVYSRRLSQSTHADGHSHSHIPKPVISKHRFSRWLAFITSLESKRIHQWSIGTRITKIHMNNISNLNTWGIHHCSRSSLCTVVSDPVRSQFNCRAYCHYLTVHSDEFSWVPFCPGWKDNISKLGAILFTTCVIGYIKKKIKE